MADAFTCLSAIHTCKVWPDSGAFCNFAVVYSLLSTIILQIIFAMLSGF